jgi:hypothetical protein
MSQNLPAYIRNRDPNHTTLAQRGLQNVGTGQGPHLSIRDNRFTLVDAAGNQMPIQTLFLDVCIIDLNDHLSKTYNEEWDPENPAPPICFSDNGVAPSTAAQSPQSLTCQGCDKNKWGSKVSNMGNEVKACRDEQKCAILVPGMPNNLFRFTVPPNSLKGWRAYLSKFTNAGFDLRDVVTRLTFKAGVNGTLEFNPAPSPWLDEATLGARDKALEQKAPDIIVGRLDRPRQGALPAPAAQEAQQQRPLDQPAQTAIFPSTATAPPQTQTASPAQAASPSDGKRRRRTKAEIEADNAKAAAPPSTEPRMAPFRPEAMGNGATLAPGPNFGISPGVAPDPALQNAINSIFGS